MLDLKNTAVFMYKAVIHIPVWFWGNAMKILNEHFGQRGFYL